MPKVAFHTLGCKVNQGETAAMAHLFCQAGYEVVPFTEVADVYLVNTCAVTVQAERKSRQMVRRARDHSPGALVVMVGCYPQVAGHEQLSELADIDLIVGSSDKHRIVQLVAQVLAEHRPLLAVSPWSEQAQFSAIGAGQESSRTRANLKVQDGCQQFCAYCIIPYARGPERSRTTAQVEAEADALLRQGYREIVLTGIHLGSYGRDLQPATDLSALLQQLLPLPRLQRLRLSSIEPNEITPEMLQLMQQRTNFCRHLHIPLQSGTDEVLKAMNRRYTTADYRRIVELARTYVPNLAITTDVIVGFPGETEEQFERTCQFIQETGFSRLHVFRYSRRPGTPAADFALQVPAAEKDRRSKTLIAIGKQLARTYAERLVGESVQVLWEHEQDGYWRGHTDTYVPVSAVSTLPLGNRLSEAKVLRLLADGVLAEVDADARLG